MVLSIYQKRSALCRVKSPKNKQTICSEYWQAFRKHSNNDLNCDLEGLFLVGPEIIQPLCEFTLETFLTRNGQVVQIMS